jgi:hypothetical protein
MKSPKALSGEMPLNSEKLAGLLCILRQTGKKEIFDS